MPPRPTSPITRTILITRIMPIRTTCSSPTSPLLRLPSPRSSSSKRRLWRQLLRRRAVTRLPTGRLRRCSYREGPLTIRIIQGTTSIITR